MPLIRNQQYSFAGPFTVADLLTIADEVRAAGVPPQVQIRVAVRPGFNRLGSHVKTLNLAMPPDAAADPPGSPPTPTT